MNHSVTSLCMFHGLYGLQAHRIVHTEPPTYRPQRHSACKHSCSLGYCSWPHDVGRLATHGFDLCLHPRLTDLHQLQLQSGNIPRLRATLGACYYRLAGVVPPARRIKVRQTFLKNIPSSSNPLKPTQLIPNPRRKISMFSRLAVFITALATLAAA